MNRKLPDSISDKELITLYVNDGNTQALDILLKKTRPLILSRIEHFGFASSEIDDLLQECMICVYMAVKSYDSTLASFNTYSRVCIDRALQSILRKRNSLKNIPYDAVISLTDVDFAYNGNTETPQGIFERVDSFSEFLAEAKSRLSKLEYSVLLYLFRGYSIGEIASGMEISYKSVDNALQRVRKKIKNMPAVAQ